MRLFNTLVYDDYAYGTVTVYSGSEHNALLGLPDHFSVFIAASQIVGSSLPLIINLETSPDQLNWATAATLGAVTITPGSTNMFELFWATTNVGYSAFLRLAMVLFAPNISCRLKVWVCGRADLEVHAPFYPSDVPNLVAAWDAGKIATISIGGTLLASGTTPPAVTISGAQTVAPAIRVEIQSSTTFRWSKTNTGAGVISWDESGITIPQGGTYALPGTGLTLTFPAATYNTNNVYQATVQAWNSVTTSDAFTAPTTTAQPKYLIDATSLLPYLKGDGSSSYMTCSSIDRPAPGTTPTWWFGLARFTTRTQVATVMNSADSTAYTIALAAASPNVGEITGTNSPVLSITITGATLTAMKEFEVGFKASAAGHSGTDPSAWGDYVKWGGVVSSVGASMGNSDPAAGLSIFARGGTAGTFLNGDIAFLALYSAYPSASDLTLLQNWASSTWGAGVLT